MKNTIIVNKSKPQQYSYIKKTTKKLKPQQLEKKFDDLYNQSARLKARKLKRKEQRQLNKSLQDIKECTFKPTVNPEISFYTSSNQTFLKRQEDWMQKKQKKIQDLVREDQKRLKNNCTFHPTISQKTYTLLHTPKKSAIQSSSSISIVGRRQLSYREIHLKKSQIKQLEKSTSIYHFSLQTQKRKNPKNIQNINQIEQNQQKDYFQKRIQDQETVNTQLYEQTQRKNRQQQHCQQHISIFQHEIQQLELNQKFQQEMPHQKIINHVNTQEEPVDQPKPEEQQCF